MTKFNSKLILNLIFFFSIVIYFFFFCDSFVAFASELEPPSKEYKFYKDWRFWVVTTVCVGVIIFYFFGSDDNAGSPGGPSAAADVVSDNIDLAVTTVENITQNTSDITTQITTEVVAQSTPPLTVPIIEASSDTIAEIAVQTVASNSQIITEVATNAVTNNPSTALAIALVAVNSFLKDNVSIQIASNLLKFPGYFMFIELDYLAFLSSKLNHALPSNLPNEIAVYEVLKEDVNRYFKVRSYFERDEGFETLKKFMFRNIYELLLIYLDFGNGEIGFNEVDNRFLYLQSIIARSVARVALNLPALEPTAAAEYLHHRIRGVMALASKIYVEFEQVRQYYIGLNDKELRSYVLKLLQDVLGLIGQVFLSLVDEFVKYEDSKTEYDTDIKPRLTRYRIEIGATFDKLEKHLLNVFEYVRKTLGL